MPVRDKTLDQPGAYMSPFCGFADRDVVVHESPSYCVFLSPGVIVTVPDTAAGTSRGLWVSEVSVYRSTVFSRCSTP